MMKVGKVAALAVGGGIILLQVANHSGYVKINWDKVFKQAEEVGSRIEQQSTSKGPKFLDKVSRFLQFFIHRSLHACFATSILWNFTQVLT